MNADAQHGRLLGVGAELQRAQALAPAPKINSCPGGVGDGDGGRTLGQSSLTVALFVPGSA